MNNTMLIRFFTLLLFVTALSCSKPDPADRVIPEGCADGPVLFTAKGREGTVLYDSTAKSYIISYTVPNTVDAVELGYVCNLPTKFSVAGRKLVFDGEYRAHEKKAPIAGQTYYHLTLFDVRNK